MLLIELSYFMSSHKYSTWWPIGMYLTPTKSAKVVMCHAFMWWHEIWLLYSNLSREHMKDSYKKPSRVIQLNCSFDKKSSIHKHKRNVNKETPVLTPNHLKLILGWFPMVRSQTKFDAFPLIPTRYLLELWWWWREKLSIL